MSETYQKTNQIYEGKASRLWEVKDCPNLLIIERKDCVTKLDGKVSAQIKGKGALANQISNLLFEHLEDCGIPTHYVEELSPTETVVERTEPIKLEVIVRNIATGSLCKRLPFEEGTVLSEPLIELDFKSDEHGDPLINEQHAIMLGLASAQELEQIYRMAREINDALKELFLDVGFVFVDIKLEFGRAPNGDIIAIDEYSPDTMRLWGKTGGESYDKDIFRKEDDPEATLEAYNTVYDRLCDRFYGDD